MYLSYLLTDEEILAELCDPDDDPIEVEPPSNELPIEQRKRVPMVSIANQVNFKSYGKDVANRTFDVPLLT
jgi:hypothetical protein